MKQEITITPVNSPSPRPVEAPLKNLLLVSVSLMCLFTASQSMNKLQSSVYFKGGLGTWAMSAQNIMHFLSSLFLAAPLNKKFGSKRVLLVSMLGFVTYIAINFKATWFTLIALAALNGLAGAILHTSLWTYIGNLGTQYSQKTGLRKDVVYARFFGLFFMFDQSASIWGNLISFEVLDQKSSSSRNCSTASCGAQFCDVNVSKNDENLNAIPKNFYLLCGIYVGISILAMVVMVFVDHQEPRGNEGTSIKLRLVETAKKLGDIDMLLVLPITLYGGLQLSFINGDYTKAYITCAYGVADVGYVFICFGVISTIFSAVSGPLVKLLGRKMVFVTAGLIDIAVYCGLIFHDYRGSEGLILLFFLIGCFGVTYSVWQGQLKALYGSLFPNCQEVAYSVLGVFEALGTSIGFLYSSALCTYAKIYILLSLLLLGMICYAVVEIRIARKQNRRQNNASEETVMD